MKALAEKMIQLRNPHFKFDPQLNSTALIQFVYIQIIGLLRAARVLLYLRNPKGATFGKGVRFFNLPRISWGRFLKLGQHVFISALGREGVVLGNNVGIGDYSKLVVSMSMNNMGAYIRIGNNVGIGEYAYLGGAGGLEIGDDCIIGQYLSCHPENHNHSNLELPIRLQGVTRQGIKIGRNCWIGSKVTILDGVTLGDGCIVAAGAVVNKSYPANSIIAGVPARLIKTRTADENHTRLRLFA